MSNGKSAAPPCVPPLFALDMSSWCRGPACSAEGLAEADCHNAGTKEPVTATADVQLNTYYTAFYKPSTTGKYKVNANK